MRIRRTRKRLLRVMRRRTLKRWFGSAFAWLLFFRGYGGRIVDAIASLLAFLPVQYHVCLTFVRYDTMAVFQSLISIATTCLLEANLS
jgi:hypothetical protein